MMVASQTSSDVMGYMLRKETCPADLTNFVYEYIAPQDYMVRPPQPAVYLFVIDVTYAAVTSGMTATTARVILEGLDSIPNRDGRTKVGFITFDSALHFYAINKDEAKMFVMADVNDPFIPFTHDQLLVNLTECRAQVEGLLKRISNFFANMWVR